MVFCLLYTLHQSSPHLLYILLSERHTKQKQPSRFEHANHLPNALRISLLTLNVFDNRHRIDNVKAGVFVSEAPRILGREMNMPLGLGFQALRHHEVFIQIQPALEALRTDFPFLADAVECYALGDVWSRTELDARSRQIAAVSAFAALGDLAFMKIHAGYALNVGVTEAELKEVVNLTTVHAGFPRAIEAAVALSNLFGERPANNAD